MDENGGESRLKEVVGFSLMIAFVLFYAWYQRHQPAMQFFTDPCRWINETERFLDGSIPYRDFTWQYPPLGIMLSAAWVAILGKSISSIFFFACALSLIIALLFWKILRILGVDALAAAIGVAAAVVSSGFSIKIRLFSLNHYTPSVYCAVIGGGLLVWGALTFLECEKRKWLIASGAGLAICFLSKPEYAYAGLFFALAFCMVVVLKTKENRLRTIDNLAMFTLSTIVPVVTVYSIFIALSGWEKVMEGLLGYGIMDMTMRNTKGNEFRMLKKLLADLIKIGNWNVIGLLLVLLFILSPQTESSSNGKKSILGKIIPLWILLIVALSGIAFVSDFQKNWPHDFLRSGKWLAVFVFLGLLIRLFRVRFSHDDKAFSGKSVAIMLFAVYIAGSCVRLFQIPGHWSLFAPHGILIWVVMFYHAGGIYGSGGMRYRPVMRTAAAAILILMLAFLFIIQGRRDSGQKKYSLETVHGSLLVTEREGKPLNNLLRYIETHTRPYDPVLVTTQGSGLNYLMGRRSPVSQTQYVMFRSPWRFVESDMIQIKAMPPPVIVATDTVWLINNSRDFNPVIWKYIDRNYVLRETFTSDDKKKKLAFRVYLPKGPEAEKPRLDTMQN